jgi:hypothetical protein
MSVAVRSNLVTGVYDHPDDARLTLGELAQHKKGSGCLVLIEESEETLNIPFLPRSKSLPSVDVSIDESLVPVFDIK